MISTLIACILIPLSAASINAFIYFLVKDKQKTMILRDEEGDCHSFLVNTLATDEEIIEEATKLLPP